MTLDQRITIRLDDDTVATLDQLVADGPAGLDRSNYIREAISQYLAGKAS
jgi:metal-responsive CopG/Arc/MetJ family transcriptional regulator